MRFGGSSRVYPRQRAKNPNLSNALKNNQRHKSSGFKPAA